MWALLCLVVSVLSQSMKIVSTLDFDVSVNSLHTAFDWGASKTCVGCAYATISSASGANPELIHLDLSHMKIVARTSLATSECPNFRSVGAARLTLMDDVSDTIYVAQANASQGFEDNSPSTCSGRVLTVSSKTAAVTGSLNDKFPGRFDGTNFLDIAFNEDEVQIAGDRYTYGWCPLCLPTIFSVADFGCGPLEWGVPDRFVADNGEPDGGQLSFRNGFVAEIFAGRADVPDTPSWGRPNNSIAIGDCCYFATAVAQITYQEITPPWPPIFEYYSVFYLARSRDGFSTKEIYLGPKRAAKPYSDYMFGPTSFGVLDTYEDDGYAFWVAFKTNGTKGEGAPVLLRVDFTYPTYQFGAALEFDPSIVSINQIALDIKDKTHLYLAVTLANGKGQILQISTGGKSPRSAEARLARKGNHTSGERAETRRRNVPRRNVRQ